MHRCKQQAITLTDRDVRDEVVARLSQHLPLSVAGYDCTTEMVWDVLAKAAVTQKTVACHDFKCIGRETAIFHRVC